MLEPVAIEPGDRPFPRGTAPSPPVPLDDPHGEPSPPLPSSPSVPLRDLRGELSSPLPIAQCPLPSSSPLPPPFHDIFLTFVQTGYDIDRLLKAAKFNVTDVMAFLADEQVKKLVADCLAMAHMGLQLKAILARRDAIDLLTTVANFSTDRVEKRKAATALLRASSAPLVPLTRLQPRAFDPTNPFDPPPAPTPPEPEHPEPERPEPEHLEPEHPEPKYQAPPDSPRGTSALHTLAPRAQPSPTPAPLAPLRSEPSSPLPIAHSPLPSSPPRPSAFSSSPSCLRASVPSSLSSLFPTGPPLSPSLPAA